jgi:shikimate kinase
MTDDDYYSWKPTLRLTRPLVLCGVPGAGVGRTARAVNLLTGVPFVWLDRRVEHQLGRSVEVVQFREGHGPRVVIEREVLAEARASAEPPVVALSDVTYEDPALARLLEDTCEVVLLHVDVDTAVERILDAAARDERAHWALREGGAVDRGELRRRLVEHEQRYRHLARVVLVRDRSPLAVAEQLVAERAPA